MERDIDLNYPPPVELDIEQVDDEVMICSRRSFMEATERARRNRAMREIVRNGHESQGIHSATLCHGTDPRTMTMKQETVPHSTSVRANEHERVMNENAATSHIPPQSMPRPMRFAFTCPICMNEIEEETSTKCGHVFCKKCIDDALARQKKCPTCRRKLRAKDTMRIYLPGSSQML